MKEVWTGAAKAAAHRIMAAFPDPVRWQNMEATGIAVRMFEPTADSGPPFPHTCLKILMAMHRDSLL